MYNLENLPNTTSWVKSLTAAEATAQLSALMLLPAATLEENRVLLSNFIRARRARSTSVVQEDTIPTPTVEFRNAVTENIQMFQSCIDSTPTANQDFLFNTSDQLAYTQAPTVYVTTQNLLPATIQYDSTAVGCSSLSPFLLHPNATLSHTTVAPTYTVPSPSHQVPVLASQVRNPRLLQPADANQESCGVTEAFSQQLTSLMSTLHRQTLETIEACRFSQPSTSSVYLSRTISDLIKPISVTTGSDNKQLLRFLIQVNNIISLGLASDQDIILSLLPKTDGSLRVLWSNAVSSCLIWGKLKQQVLNGFYPVRTFRTIVNDFVYRLQRPNETFREFIDDIKQSADLLTPDMPEGELVATILQGINPHTRLHLSMQTRPTTLNQLDTLATVAAEVSEIDNEYKKTFFNQAQQFRPYNYYNSNTNNKFSPPQTSYPRFGARPAQFNRVNTPPYRPTGDRGVSPYQIVRQQGGIGAQQGERQNQGNVNRGRR